MISVKGLVFPVAIICIHTSLGKRETGKKKKKKRTPKNTKNVQEKRVKGSRFRTSEYFAFVRT